MSTQSWGPVRQINAGPLSVGYVDTGSADGRAVLLLHGWPYDIHTYADAASVLAEAGYRVVVPFLRGFGTTRFRLGDAVRTGQQAALAADVIDLMDALRIESAILAGCDWGARTANVVAALWPQRCRAMVSVSRLPDRQSDCEQVAAATSGRALVVVPVLLRHRTGSRRLRPLPTGLRETDLAHRVTAVELR